LWRYASFFLIKDFRGGSMTLKRAILTAADAPFRVALGPARFYLDDILDILKALREFSEQQHSSHPDQMKQPTIEIRARDAIAEEVGDLQDATSRELSRVSLILSAPKIKIDLHSWQAEVIAESDSPTVKAFVEGIRSFTKQRRNWTVALVYNRMIWVFLALLAFAISDTLAAPQYSSWALYSFSTSVNAGEFVATLVLIMAGIIYFLKQYRNIVIVVPLWRKESRRITGQARIAIIAALVSAAVAGVLSFWAGALVHK
jgi:hypothetical protein